MNPTLISVITPVHNNEKYLPLCVESVLKQSFSDWEMILVDDGSTDQSGTLCDDFAERDQRIHVIHQGNKGVSAARNAGIREAAGRYLFFLDADDQISSDMFEEIAIASKENQPDVLIINMKKIAGPQKYKESDWFISFQSVSEKIHKILACGYLREVCRKCCKRQLFDQIQFPEDQGSAEDLYITADLAASAGSFGVVDHAWYFYNKINQDSATHDNDMRTKDINNYKAWKHFYSLGKAHHLDTKAPNLLDRYKNKMTEFAISLLQQGISKENKETEEKIKTFLQKEGIPFTAEKDKRQQKTLAACRALRDSYKLLGTLSPTWAKRGIKELIRLFTMEASAPFLKKEKEDMLSLLLSLCTPEVRSSLTLGQKMAVWSIKRGYLNLLNFSIL